MIKKRLIIDLDVLTGDVNYEHEEEMTYAEMLLALETTKMLIWVDYMKKSMD